MDEQVTRRVLGLIGLGVRGRNAVIGVEQVRQAAASGKLKLAIVASDASRNSLDKVMPLLAAKRVMVVELDSAVALGEAVGRRTTAAVGIVDVQLAKGIRGVVDSAPR